MMPDMREIASSYTELNLPSMYDSLQDVVFDVLNSHPKNLVGYALHYLLYVDDVFLAPELLHMGMRCGTV